MSVAVQCAPVENKDRLCVFHPLCFCVGKMSNSLAEQSIKSEEPLVFHIMRHKTNKAVVGERPDGLVVEGQRWRAFLIRHYFYTSTDDVID